MRAVLVLMSVLVSAPVWATEIPSTIPRVVLPAPELSNYSRLLVDPALNARLSGPGPMTALVPRDRAATSALEGPQWSPSVEEGARQARALVLPQYWTPEMLRGYAQGSNNRGLLETDTGESLMAMQTASGRLLLVDEYGNTAAVVGPVRPAGNGAVLVLDRPLEVN